MGTITHYQRHTPRSSTTQICPLLHNRPIQKVVMVSMAVMGNGETGSPTPSSSTTSRTGPLFLLVVVE